MEGWISIHRKLKEHWLYDSKPFCKSFAWIDLLLSVNHSDNKFNLGNQIIAVTKGSFITSEVKLAEKWGWSRKSVRAFLHLLEADQMLVKKSTTKYTSITIANWESYQIEGQQKEQQRNNKGTTKEQQRNTNNNENNENNVDNENKKSKVDFENLINGYSENGELKESIKNYIQHRKNMKKPVDSEQCLNLIFKKLNKYPDTDKIEMINESIMNRWQGLFELKKNNNKKEPETVNLFKKLMEEGAFDE